GVRSTSGFNPTPVPKSATRIARSHETSPPPILHLAAGAAALPAVSRFWLPKPAAARELGGVTITRGDLTSSGPLFCKRDSVNVRFAPKGTKVLPCREASLWTKKSTARPFSGAVQFERSV